MIPKLQRERKVLSVIQVAQQLYSCDEYNENKGEAVTFGLVLHAT